MITRAAILSVLLCAVSTTQGFTFQRSTTYLKVNTKLNASNANELVPLKKGSIVALVTPMTLSGTIDTASLRSLLQYHKQSKTDGLCILGTTGEASLLSMEERKLVLDIAVEEVKGDIPLLVGTGAIDPVQVREMTLQAKDCGCDASLVVTPPYIKPPQRGLVKHFVTMAELGLPVVVYNVPGRTASDCLPETIAMCAKESENIVGVKEATGDVGRIARIQDALKAQGVEREILLYSGDDATEAEFVLKGGHGCISVTANVAAKDMHEMMMACLEGREEDAMRINDKLEMLHTKIFCEANPIPAKWAAHRLGMIETPYCRPPLDILDASYYPDLEKALTRAGLM